MVYDVTHLINLNLFHQKKFSTGFAGVETSNEKLLEENMTESAIKPKRETPWFQLFKYTVYSMLTINCLLFLNRELKSSAHRFGDELMMSDWIDAFSSTIDSGNWVILILLFELETYVLSDEILKGNIKWLLRIIRSICYVFLVYAFYGYVIKYWWVMDFTAVQIDSLCEYIGQSWMNEVDEFDRITKENCSKFSESIEIFKKSDKNIFTDIKHWTNTFWLVFVDIFNAGAWILVLAVLEIDIWLQLKSKFTGTAYRISKIAKGILYSVLLGLAIAWGVNGNFLDFWDAFLWIVAFIFIENNLFEWQSGISEKAVYFKKNWIV